MKRSSDHDVLIYEHISIYIYVCMYIYIYVMDTDFKIYWYGYRSTAMRCKLELAQDFPASSLEKPKWALEAQWSLLSKEAH